ncbi:GNAT family N-acetyltransferase [Olleya sp. HaHaR_3_96]|uniref:GNAT family N-acetyltransferase n=1 Tax=Olleya sp. HaHaR_3_96 TaxID=2745560 RepID=UPI001C4F740F|nr:GNAT family N-acetyltransferase [Olleya sp. HaHaR_3_96]QXP58700.1 GNAT family N-acetyltransferase [Olleya sp. HaHaR_3_96]
MTIQNATINDIEDIFKLYKIASDYQKTKKTVVVWPDFERQLVATEIKENRQFKLIINNTIACVWAITFKDDQIWETSQNDNAMYIHRIATNPEFRGQHFVTKIVDWAKGYASTKAIDYIRLDTLGNNTGLIAYYKQSGFDFLGIFDLKNTNGLPEHYHNQPACLFQIQLSK